MSGRGVVFLGDLVKTVSLLQPGDLATATAMARLLGLSPSEPDHLELANASAGLPSDPATRFDRQNGIDRRTPPAAVADPRPQVVADRSKRPSSDVDPERDEPDQRPQTPSSAPMGPADRAPRLAERPIDFSLVLTRLPAQDESRDSLPGPGTIAASGDLFAQTEGAHDAGPTVEPPWTPEWSRGVMVAAVSAPVASRRLDQRTLVRKVSRQEVLRAVPWQRRPSTRLGVQLLLDHSAGMAPFQDDRRWLCGLMASVAGRDRVSVLRFTGSPLRGVMRTGSSVLETHRAPAPGTPAVLVSDLGHARPPFTGSATGRLDEWLTFIDGLLHGGCPPVCLTPFPVVAYPSSITERVALIPFDRRISLRHAQEATRKIHRLLEERR